MVRLACVSLPAFPLQLLARRRPEAREQPAAVVEADRAQARLRWVNARAWTSGVRPGMRFAQALSLAADLFADTVPDGEIARGTARVTALLHRFTPHVEPAEAEPGVFWLDGGGLGRLYPEPRDWAEAVADAPRDAGFQATVVAGGSRFGTYAVARALRGVWVLDDPVEECRLARAVPLERLGLAPGLRDALGQLGIATVGDLLTLPPAGLSARFGREVYRLHRLAAGALDEPWRPRPEAVPWEERVVLDDPVNDAHRLLFLIKPRLQALLDALAARSRLLTRLELYLVLAEGTRQTAAVQPAAPTLNATVLLELVRLRLEALRLKSGVIELGLRVADTRALPEQLSLLDERPRRDLAAGDRALARLRAELGDDAVVRARLRDGHLPEVGFAWEPVSRLTAPAPRARPSGPRPLVRRLLARPEPLPGWPREPDRSGFVRDAAERVAALQGPYTVAGGWWARPLHRDYHFAELDAGEVWWVYHDRRRRRWYRHGRVE